MGARSFASVSRALSIVQGTVENEGLAWLASEPRVKLAALVGRGRAPVVPPSGPPHRAISVVTVRRDASCSVNLLASPAFSDSALSLSIVDDAFGLRYGSVSRALAAGVRSVAAPVDGERAVLAFVDQRVWLPEGWAGAVDAALRQLEAHDPGWGVAGVSGVTPTGTRVGHVSDPWGIVSSFAGGVRWADVAWLEDHVLVLPADRRLALDENLPGFEGLGSWLSQAARAAGRGTYVIDAPVIVERQDRRGRRVTRAIGSPTVRAQLYRQQRIQREVTIEYLAGPSVLSDAGTIAAPFRWSADPSRGRRPAPDRAARAASSPPGLDRPLILLAKGGGGSRLLSILAGDCGVFLGHTNVSGDSLDMVPAVYAGLLRLYDCPAAWQRDRVVDGLRQGAAAMLRSRAAGGRPWGFKVPESLLVVPQLDAAFPGARFLFLARHPVSTCLRRVHMTAQPDNPIGRVSLAAAYRSAGLTPEAALAEPGELRSARVTLHQVGSAIAWLRARVPQERLMEIRFEDVVTRPAEARAAVARWLGFDVVSRRLERDVNADRASRRSAVPMDTRARVEQVLAPLTAALGFAPLASGSGDA